MGIKFDKNFLVVEQSNQAAILVSAYIVYELLTWSNNSLRNITLKNCLFGVTNIVKIINKAMFLCSSYGIAFDGKALWSFANNFARNVVFGVDNSSSSHKVNCENDSLILGEGDAFDINAAPEKKLY